MNRRAISETSRNKVENKLKGQISALEFLLGVKTDQVIREQARIAELAILLLGKGIYPHHVFADSHVSDHIIRCIYEHDKGAFKQWFPNGFKESNPEVSGPPSGGSASGGLFDSQPLTEK